MTRSAAQYMERGCLRKVRQCFCLCRRPSTLAHRHSQRAQPFLSFALPLDTKLHLSLAVFTPSHTISIFHISTW